MINLSFCVWGKMQNICKRLVSMEKNYGDGKVSWKFLYIQSVWLTILENREKSNPVSISRCIRCICIC